MERCAWAPSSWITDSGLVLSWLHVAKVGSGAQYKAVCETSKIITRMMKP